MAMNIRHDAISGAHILQQWVIPISRSHPSF